MKDLIKNKLLQTRKCKFKSAWLPKGWTCIHIETFVKELDADIRKEFYVANRKPKGVK